MDRSFTSTIQSLEMSLWGKMSGSWMKINACIIQPVYQTSIDRHELDEKCIH
jgi:hypothetical protein